MNYEKYRKNWKAKHRRTRVFKIKIMNVKIQLKPVSVNEAFQGRRFKTKKCKQYCDDFLLVAPRKNMVKGIIQVQYRFHVKNHAMTDYDNLIKITQDMIVKKGYIEDDRKIYRATIYKIPSKDNFIEIKILPYKIR